MIELEPINWPRRIVDAAKENQLSFFVGNGLSRLSGAPSWDDLFADEELTSAFLKDGLDISKLSYLERATIAKRNYQEIWNRIKIELDLKVKRAHPSLSHLVLSKVLLPSLSRDPHRKNLLTSNFDGLLEKAGFNSWDIIYLHGNPSDKTSWVLSGEEYFESYESGAVSRKMAGLTGHVILFLGYSHSHEDFDIARSVSRLREDRENILVDSLVSLQDTPSGLRERLRRENISLIEYKLSRDATAHERDMRLAHLLLDLANQAGLDKTEDYRSLRATCSKNYAQYWSDCQRASLVMGLAGTNRHLQLADEIPSGGRRASMRVSVDVEPGGPGYIVSKILQATDNDSFLVTKIADDPEGQAVLSSVDNSNRIKSGQGRIFTDYIDIAKSASQPTSFRTWESFILEPGRSDLHRVFLDRSVEIEKMVISDQAKNMMSKWVREDRPRIVYFDKFFRGDIQHIFVGANNTPKLSEAVWTVCETGSEGDRYSNTKPGFQFNKDKAYHLERYLSPEGGQSLNVVTASFRFARDFLADKRGGLSKADFLQLIHKDDSEEITKDHALALTEDEVIGRLVSEDQHALLDSFCDAVARGAAGFLRNHDLRMIVITLHGNGCIMMMVPLEGDVATKHIKGIKVPGRLYTASAGDVFRGVLVSALAFARKHGADAKNVMDTNFVEELGQLCNRCAAHKVAVPSIELALPAIVASFEEWRVRQKAKTWYHADIPL